jgi:hypothetical protein
MSTFVSKNALSGIGLDPVKNESGGQRPAQSPQASQSALAALIAADFEHPVASDSNLYPVAFF